MKKVIIGFLDRDPRICEQRTLDLWTEAIGLVDKESDLWIDTIGFVYRDHRICGQKQFDLWADITGFVTGFD